MYGRAIVIAGVTASPSRASTALAGAGARADGVIVGCQKPGKGFLRVVREASDCRRNERVITWNERGAAGPPGPAGAAGLRAGSPRGRRATRAPRGGGAAGPIGPRCGRSGGPPGPAGPLGLQEHRLRRPAGSGRSGLARSARRIACTRFDGAAGTLDVVVTSANLIELRCVAGGTPPPPPPPPPPTSTLVINEIDYDQVGADTGRLRRDRQQGSSAATLDGIALVLVNGGDGAEYARVALTGSLAAGSYLQVDIEAQNGAPDGVALIDTASKALSTLSHTRARSRQRRSTGRRTTSWRALRSRRPSSTRTRSTVRCRASRTGRTRTMRRPTGRSPRRRRRARRTSPPRSTSGASRARPSSGAGALALFDAVGKRRHLALECRGSAPSARAAVHRMRAPRRRRTPARSRAGNRRTCTRRQARRCRRRRPSHCPR